jgi:hypothetical protein
MNTTNYALLYSCACKYDKLRIEKERRKNCKFTDVKAFRRMEPERVDGVGELKVVKKT